MDSDALKPEQTTEPEGPEIVWLKDRTPERWAFLVHRGAYYSTVRWEEEGILYEDEVENSDYELWSERAIEIEPDTN